MIMTDLELYAHLEEYVSECHIDGMCFVEPYNYADFVGGLPLNDSENGIDAHISTNGTLCFDIDELEWMCDDFDIFKLTFLNKHAS